MNLYQLSKSIDPIILDRGRDYVLDGCVLSIEIMGDKAYRAEVEGSQLYEVYIKLGDEGTVILSECDCPYDYSPICKHQAAVLLTLRDQIAKSVEPPTFEICDSTNTSLKELLEAESKESLIDLIGLLAADSDVLEKRIQLHLSKTGGIGELDQCRELIQSYIQIHADDHGFVNWRSASRAVDGAHLVAEKAYAAFEDTEWVRAVEINLIIMEEMIDLLESTDDSGGNVGGMIEGSLESIGEITRQADRLPQADGKRIFQLLLNESKQSRYNGWTNWRLDLLEMASRLVHIAGLREQWDRHVAELSDTGSDNYFAEKIALMRYQLIRLHDGNDQARDFLSKHLAFSKFREMTIQEALHNGRYDEVIRLSEEGEALDQAKGLRGLVSQWKKCRYEAYSHSKQIELQRSLGVEFLLDGDFIYYKPVKSIYPAEEWKVVYEEILKKLEMNPRSGEIYTRILVEEREYARLLDYIQKRPSNIEQFHSLLYPNYPQEVKALFLSYIEAKADKSTNRQDYADVCRIIRMLQKAGGKEETRLVVRVLLAKYPRRPAFQDELMKI